MPLVYYRYMMLLRRITFTYVIQKLVTFHWEFFTVTRLYCK